MHHIQASQSPWEEDPELAELNSIEKFDMLSDGLGKSKVFLLFSCFSGFYESHSVRARCNKIQKLFCSCAA